MNRAAVNIDEQVSVCSRLDANHYCCCQHQVFILNLLILSAFPSSSCQDTTDEDLSASFPSSSPLPFLLLLEPSLLPRMSSEKLDENHQPKKLSFPRGSQDKETSDFTMPTYSLSQTINTQKPQQFAEMHLAEIQKLFEKETGKSGALDKKTFTRIMRKVMSDMTEEMLEVLFLKVDSDCNGFVNWQEYVDYMMREFQGKEEIRKSQYRLRFHLPMTIIPLHHGSEIVKVEFLFKRFKTMGYFLTVTKDGLLQFWSEAFSMISSFRLAQPQQFYRQQMWVVDMICLHNMNLIAVASTELKIEFYDISNQKCIRVFTFIDMDSCVMVMNYWTDNQKGVFCFGDAKGNVVIFITENVASGLFNPQILPRTIKWDQWINIPLQKLLNEKSSQYRNFRVKSLHSTWCQQIKFIPQLNVVASCSAIERSSLVLVILPAKGPEKPRLSSLNLRKGILCFDYCPERNFLVTGGYDPHIRLWNPLVSKKPVWLMKGHQTSVTHLLVNSKYTSILISISRDKNIRVWDLHDYVCLQSFCGKFFPLGNCPITSAYFHRDSTLICSTYDIGILGGYLESQGPTKTGKMTTHSSILCAVLYSKIFKQVVSGCLVGTVSVWDITTGKKRMEFSVCGIQQAELTAMALDESERCLLTGLRDGILQMWNYNTGECLMSFPNPDGVEISGIVHMKKAYYMAGWSKRITHFTFHRTMLVLSCYHWQTFHTEDILCMAKYQNQFLGTASYNGDIIFWNVSMLKPILSFNASRSPLPIQLKKIIFLQTRPRLPHTAAMLSSCIDGFIYAWSIHGNGGLLGKFPVDLKENGDNAAVGAMATDENDWILLTGDSKGVIKIWDIKDYCLFTGWKPPHPSEVKDSGGKNKFRLLISKQLQLQPVNHIPQKEKEVVEGHTISLVPPPLLVSWTSHVESIADILFVETFQVVISAGKDRDVKAWKLTGDAIGTFGPHIWEKLQDGLSIDDLEQMTSVEEKPDSVHSTEHVVNEASRRKELEAALLHQQREQAALMALLHGKEEKEAEAWARLHQMSLISPWKGREQFETEESWNEWVKDKQVSTIVGAAYKPKERVRNANLLASRVQYNWMRQQISPQVYQSLCCTDLKPVQHPDFLMFRVLDQQSRHIRWVASDIRNELEAVRGQIFTGTSSTPLGSISSLSVHSLGASASRIMDPTPVKSSASCLRPFSASPAPSASSLSPQTFSRRGLGDAALFLGATTLRPSG
nr:LOW QUALITY PROTEIN: EF-hand calcium-binding domain-containing protein 8 [Meriones unguiculatus]